MLMVKIGTSAALLGIASLGFANTLGVPGRDYVANEILVKYRPGRSGTISRLGLPGRVVETIPQLNVARVRLHPGMTVERAVRSVNRGGQFEYAEPNYKKELIQVRPNDPRYSEQYFLPKIAMEQAWARVLGSATVKVAVVDTGTNLEHEDLKPVIAPGGRDFSDNDNDPNDYQGHGSHVSGIAGAATNNALGVAGVGYGVRILPLKIFPNATNAVSAAALVYAADQGCKVISMSYGSYGRGATEEAAVNYAWSKGVVLVGGAANDNITNEFYPGAFPNVIAVGSTQQEDRKSDFSNWGQWVDVAAPGSNIMSTYFGSTTAYQYSSGTSMATPVVAGAAAILFSWSPTASNADVRRALEISTDPVVGINPGTGRPWFANGRINVNRALDSLRPPIAFEDTPDWVTVFTNGTAEGTAPLGFVDGTTFAPSLSASDNSKFTIGSVNVKGVGQIASMAARVPLLEPGDTIVGGNVRLQGTTTSLNTTSVIVYMLNFETNRYDRIGTTVLNGNDQLVPLPKNFGAYVDSQNRATVVVRSILPSRLARSPYAAHFDLLTIEGSSVQ